MAAALGMCVGTKGIQKATLRKNMRSKWHTANGLRAAIADLKKSDDRVAQAVKNTVLLTE